MTITDKGDLIININEKTRIFSKDEVKKVLTDSLYVSGIDPPISEKTDSIVEAVREDLLNRSRVGLKKYGVALDRTDLSLRDWLQHSYEECLDMANYLKRSIIELDKINLK